MPFDNSKQGSYLSSLSSALFCPKFGQDLTGRLQNRFGQFQTKKPLVMNLAVPKGKTPSANGLIGPSKNISYAWSSKVTNTVTYVPVILASVGEWKFNKQSNGGEFLTVGF